MRSLLPRLTDHLDVDQIASLYAYPDAGLVRANMVTSLDGAVTASSRTEPISGPPDKYMFGLLRALADVVVVGAGTVRAEGYGPGRERTEFAHLREAAEQTPAPTMAVVTRSGQLDPTSSLFTEAKTRTIVMTCEMAATDRIDALANVADIEVCGEHDVNLAVAHERLRARGLQRVLVEGGPRLLGDVVMAGLLDELALSISPLVVGGEAGRIVATPSLILEHMKLRALLEADDFLFGLYERRRDEVAA